MRLLYPVFALTILIIASSLALCGTITTSSSSAITNMSNDLSDHWIQGWGYRDELNTSDIDYQNFWLDNAGKILTMSAVTNDHSDFVKALSFVTGNSRFNFNGSNYYLPEVVVNSSIQPVTKIGNLLFLTNGIVELEATNATSEINGYLDQLAIGNYYASPVNLAYLGVDRLWLIAGGSQQACRANSSIVFSIPGGFSKRSYFSINSGSLNFYTYLNATLAPGEPYTNVSVQIRPLDSSTIDGDYMFLQSFSTSADHPFYTSSLYYQNGTFRWKIPYEGANATTIGGLALAYSNQSSVFTSQGSAGEMNGQDAIAISFTSNEIYDVEHYYQDGVFSGNSWLGIGLNAPQSQQVGIVSSPVFSKVFPINHFDWRLANDTARFIAEGKLENVTVSPSVSFGFISYGLALASKENSSILQLARGYWNYYYDRYNSSDYGTEYARSVNLLSLAGFSLYGCNATVENFARRFLSNNPGGSIEEYGWAIAALYQLYNCSRLEYDRVLYQSILNRYVPNASNFITVLPSMPSEDYTFQFGEAASGLLLGNVSYNSPVVLSLIDGVFQSNVSGVVLNQPYHGDLANTETLPAYILSTWLFQNEMRNSTGWYITGIKDANITWIGYANKTLLISATGNNGEIDVSNGTMSKTFPVNGVQTVLVTSGPTSSITITTTFTSTTTATTTITTTPCLICSPSFLFGILIGAFVAVFVTGAVFLWRRRK